MSKLSVNTLMKKLIKYLIGFSICIFLMMQAYYFIYGDGTRRGCVLDRDKMTISTVTCGSFVESIPQNGIVMRKGEKLIVKVEIDELFFLRISKGLKASSIIKDKSYELIVSKIDSIITNGRFNIELNFDQQISDSLLNSQARLRIKLNEPRNAVLVPVGGFYKDTGGKWIFVIEGNMAVKKEIKLGRKSPDYFEVIEGLKSGDRVITSTYESFTGKESIDIAEIEQRMKK